MLKPIAPGADDEAAEVSPLTVEVTLVRAHEWVVDASPLKNIAAASALALGLAAGGYGIASAASSSGAITPSTTSAPGAAEHGGWNTDPAYEAGESEARKAEEAAGNPGFNTDPAHEAGESAERKAEEAAADAAQPQASASSSGSAAKTK